MRRTETPAIIPISLQVGLRRETRVRLGWGEVPARRGPFGSTGAPLPRTSWLYRPGIFALLTVVPAARESPACASERSIRAGPALTSPRGGHSPAGCCPTRNVMLAILRRCVATHGWTFLCSTVRRAPHVANRSASADSSGLRRAAVPIGIRAYSSGRRAHSRIGRRHAAVRSHRARCRHRGESIGRHARPVDIAEQAFAGVCPFGTCATRRSALSLAGRPVCSMNM